MSSSSQVVPDTPDVLVRNEGTVFLFCPPHFPRQTVDRGARPAGRSVVWERLGRRAPFRLGSRPRDEGCRIGAGMITDIRREEMTTKRVALYARVSTLNHGQDPEVQLRELREFCQRRRFEIVLEYVDKGISGSRERRPSLDKLMTACRKRLVDAVVVYRYDRFARSLRQLVLALEEFRALGIASSSAISASEKSRIAGNALSSPPDNKNPVWGRAKYILKTHKEIKWLEKHVAKAEEEFHNRTGGNLTPAFTIALSSIDVWTDHICLNGPDGETIVEFWDKTLAAEVFEFAINQQGKK